MKTEVLINEIFNFEEYAYDNILKLVNGSFKNKFVDNNSIKCIKCDN